MALPLRRFAVQTVGLTLQRRTASVPDGEGLALQRLPRKLCVRDGTSATAGGAASNSINAVV